ncbi:Flagellar hook-basal body complex protein FliE [Fundidesulfovibrio magnetotacticus]|uniref:Flagellar hook-basal body complex protein FliE n=1 Tax=Fundidesulfovibrio magnetotacticus TaxID=2730080 RepID=A0A6V8LVP9_9BACT|nr:flagellar hook-basal body complex protein FliE [Fundidesulfovibrio magnetotacticus]GFK93747.1 Flagellar hook-basal body complex protein FliE [Fundidesulfovibrio magnetotacticus]
MAISPIALNAYRSAMGQTQGGMSIQKQVEGAVGSGASQTGFVDTLKNSVAEVNAEQLKKDRMVASFATGENQNVHELMIQLQKAGVAMSMTSAVRGKVLDMYRELVKMPF